MRLKGLLIFTGLMLAASVSFAAFVGSERLDQVASALAKTRLAQAETSLNTAYTLLDDGAIVMRAYDLPGGGYLLLAGSDAVYPLLGYSMQGSFSGERPPALEDWLAMYREQILLAEEMSREGILGQHPAWEALLENASQIIQPDNSSVGPLLSCNWNQGKYYNALCPLDTAGPGGRVYAGCVATAMGMAMHYYKYPSQGQGAHSYYASNYGQLSVNFSAESYDWYAVETSSDNHLNDEIARILYHCGVGVEMMYSPNGSGAFMWDARDALVNYFGYSSSSSLVYKSSYSDSGWKTLIKQQLDQKMPLIFAGYPTGGGSGHAFVLDGYQGTDHFHFNWGWSAAYNGYFYLSALNPGGNNFSGGQQAIINLLPAANYPQHCTGIKTITHVRGTLFDGSGPSEHAPNSDCIWTINPGNVEKFIIYLDTFNPGDPGDSLIIYGGTDIFAPVLFSFNWDTAIHSFTINEDVITVRFVSNSSLQGDGFELSYHAVLMDYCKGTTNFSAASGTLSDGSGQDNYRDGSLCKWNIESGNGQPLALSFTLFDIAPGDFVRVYDTGTQPVTVLGQFSGTTLPPMLISPSGKMLLLFFSDQQLNADGWEAQWQSGANIGIAEGAESYPIVFPNPAASSFTVANMIGADITRIRLMNLHGQRIDVPTVMHKGSIEFDTSSLPAGLYLLDPALETVRGFLKIQIVK